MVSAAVVVGAAVAVEQCNAVRVDGRLALGIKPLLVEGEAPPSQDREKKQELKRAKKIAKDNEL